MLKCGPVRRNHPKTVFSYTAIITTQGSDLHRHTRDTRGNINSEKSKYCDHDCMSFTIAIMITIDTIAQP